MSVWLHIKSITTPTNTALGSPTPPSKDPVFTGLQLSLNQLLRLPYRGIDSGVFVMIFQHSLSVIYA